MFEEDGDWKVESHFHRDLDDLDDSNDNDALAARGVLETRSPQRSHTSPASSSPQKGVCLTSGSAF
jgi:hypothetical protein